MSNTVEIYELKLENARFRPTDPNHWIVMVKEFNNKPWEFKRGGLMTREKALNWCRLLADDYEDATEVFAYELDNSEMQKRIS